jgi:hypothetical protein
MRKKKTNALLASSAQSAVKSTNQRAALVDALFAQETQDETINDEESVSLETKSEPESSELDRRILVSKTWSRWCMLERHQQSSWERAFLLSKIEALEALKETSTLLYRLSQVPVTSLPPINRRPPSLTAPLNLPFTMGTN